jgi:hypothetical protein
LPPPLHHLDREVDAHWYFFATSRREAPSRTTRSRQPVE